MNLFMKLLFSKTLSNEFMNRIKNQLPFSNEPVAIKLHMGEPKNKNHLKPEEVKKFVDILKELGCEPFLFDTTVTYDSERKTKEGYLKVARINGFTEEFIGCPIIIGDIENEVVKGRIDYEIPKEICGKSVLVLTHVKGHVCCGVGGAIKNLGMGCVTKKTKNEIHAGGKPVYIGGCVLCGSCVENCPLDSMALGKKGPILPEESGKKCYGCSNCVISCPHGALKPRVAKFDLLLAEAAKSAMSKFKRYYFVNFLVRMSKRCDCINEDLKPVIGDIGILAGNDIVAIEKATYDLIFEKAGKDIFKELNKKSFMVQIESAEEMGMGMQNYEIESV